MTTPEIQDKIKKCEEELAALRKELGENDKYLDLTKLAVDRRLFPTGNALAAGFAAPDCISIQDGGPNAGRAFYLCFHFNWELRPHKGGYELIPTRKG